MFFKFLPKFLKFDSVTSNMNGGTIQGNGVILIQIKNPKCFREENSALDCSPYIACINSSLCVLKKTSKRSIFHEVCNYRI